ncbi:MAG: carboxymuconolactone decarboxylase family protein [Acidobacteriaceae bacterium]|nr:carboxymuconolactone decarboxylase family protein [Acidobacteriaceae bacterium]
MEKETSPRVPFLEREQVSPEVATIYDALLKQRGVVPNMFKVLAHSPVLAIGMAGFLKGLLGDSALPGWYKELVATRISVLNDSAYAISAHSLSAKQKGASDAQIAAVKGDFEDGPFSPAEKLGFRCADRLHRSPREVDEEFFAELKCVYNEAQLVELIATAAAFELFPRFLGALCVPTTPIPQEVVRKQA